MSCVKFNWSRWMMNNTWMMMLVFVLFKMCEMWLDRMMKTSRMLESVDTMLRGWGMTYLVFHIMVNKGY